MAEYQTVILVEFVAAELLVAMTPIASRQHVAGLSPYAGKDMLQMLSIGLLYFILELFAATGHGARFAAWFGGLVLLTVGLAEAASIVKDLDLFAGINPNAGAAKNG